MASKYAEDIGYIKASVKGMHQDIVEVRHTQEKHQTSIDLLLADAAFRLKLRRVMQVTGTVIVLAATAKFGDIKALF